jgi:hypothetical protein
VELNNFFNGAFMLKTVGKVKDIGKFPEGNSVWALTKT